MFSKIIVKSREELKKKILQCGYSERALSKLIGRSPIYITQILNLERNPHTEAVNMICSTLNIEFDDFFYVEHASKCKSESKITNNEADCEYKRGNIFKIV